MANPDKGGKISLTQRDLIDAFLESHISDRLLIEIRSAALKEVEAISLIDSTAARGLLGLSREDQIQPTTGIRPVMLGRAKRWRLNKIREFIENA